MKDVVYIALAVVAAFALCVAPGAQDQGLKTFASADELSEFLEGQQGSYGYGVGLARDTAMQAVAEGAPQAAGAEKGGDYSTTNIQVAGVDEADFVKNDGKYIYTISGSSVTITDAFPAENMKILSTINLSGSNPSQIYINGDRLVVFGNVYNYQYDKPIPADIGGGIGSSGTEPAVAPESKMAAESMIYCIREPCPGYGRPTTYIRIYDVSDRSNPVLARDLVFNGSYYNSRMIGNQVYAILTVPTYGKEIPAFSPYQRGFPEIYYFDMPSYSYQYTNVLSLDVTGDAEVKNKVFLLGYSTNMYVSENNIYLVYQKQLGQYYTMEKILDVTVPLLPVDVASEITAIRVSGKSDYRKYGEIQLVLSEWTQNNPQAAANMQQQLSGQMEQIYKDIYREQDKSIVHRIAIDGGDINYIGSGEVPGMPLNQFSMDEHNGYFRIATTTNQWQEAQSNNMYVMDSSMNVVGRLEGLAPGERIFSARFMGDRAYLVTFVRIDPLFVIDLTDPTAPKVLGELKIPGVSEYLHPYDDTHIIGIGQNTQDINGRVTFKGLKISLFDVSDVANPQELAKYELGDRGTYSEALYDHHAFFFNKNLLVIPVSLYEQKPTQSWGEFVWQGAYAFNVDLTGITVKGSVTHANGTDIWSNAIRRSLYIGDVLYTVSDGKIKANALGDFADISSVDLPRDYYYGGPYYAL